MRAAQIFLPARAKYAWAGLLLSATVLSGCVAYSLAPLSVADLARPAYQSLPPAADRHTLLKLALERDPALQAARARLVAAEAGVRSSKNLPALSLTLTAEYSKAADAQRPWLYGGSVGIPVDIGGQRNARVTTAELAVAKARYDVGEAAWTVRQTLIQALTDLATARQEIIATQALIDQRNAYAQRMARRTAAGEDTQGVAVQARIDASALIDPLTQARSKEAQAKASLARLLNVSVTEIDALPVIDLAPPPAVSDHTLQTLSDQALYARADILTAVVDYDSAENDLRAAVAGQYPDINIAPGYTWERGVVKVPVSASLTLPPLDGNRANIRQAEAARTAAGKTLENTVKTVQATIVQAAMTYEADRGIAEKVRTVDLPLAGTLAERSERLTRAGETDQTENLTASIALSQARLAALTADQTVLNDRLKLEDALHQSFDPIETELLTAAAGSQ